MKAALALAALALATAACAPATGDQPNSTLSIARQPATRFSFHAFGDAGWARSHGAEPLSGGGFERAYRAFDSGRELLGDINYINWETSVGNQCDAYWSPASASTFAFLTSPKELEAVTRIGFNLIGLANNHSYDCLRSAEGHGPLQTVAHIDTLKQHNTAANRTVLFSGVFRSLDLQTPATPFQLSTGTVPVRFLSAYVGGDQQHCRHLLCDRDLHRLKPAMGRSTGFRVLALHSWNPASHTRLKRILRTWLEEGLVDIAIGTGPHVAESLAVIATPGGHGVLATSLGNFIHPGLAAQPNNILLISGWSFDQASGRVRLHALSSRRVACHGAVCQAGPEQAHPLPEGAASRRG
ncbi:MAG: CapA family protein [Synechococcaceae cyanobacterium]|nr:CapA family protein [Synechococcaceae cyanobacterium]